MRLVGKRSIIRFWALCPVYAGFAFVVALPDAGFLLRGACLLVVLLALFEGAAFLICVRQWRIRDGYATIPTLFQRSRRVVLDDLRQVRVFGGGPVRFAHGLPRDANRGFDQLAINMFVSDRDLDVWLDAAREESSIC